MAVVVKRGGGGNPCSKCTKEVRPVKSIRERKFFLKSFDFHDLHKRIFLLPKYTAAGVQNRATKINFHDL